jgi:hypothetical protein
LHCSYKFAILISRDVGPPFLGPFPLHPEHDVKRLPFCYNGHMSSQWSKDIRLIEALDQIRQRNQAFMSYCYFCGDKSTTITAIKEKLYPVCSTHEDSRVDQ